MYIADEWKYDYQMWVRGRRVTSISRYWEKTGPGMPGPYGVAMRKKLLAGQLAE